MRVAAGTAAALMAVVFCGCNSKSAPVEDQAAPVAGTTSHAKMTDEQKAVRSVLAEQFKVEPSVIGMDQPITEPPLSADDLDLVEIVMELEDRFGISIPDTSVPLVSEKSQLTPNQLVSIVQEAQKNKAAK